MKKKLLALLVGFLAASSLSACGKTPEKTENTVTCGDGKLSDGEKCDIKITAGQPGACPTSCDKGTLEGENCQAHCVVPVCGNGKVDKDKGETCDIDADKASDKCVTKRSCESKKASDGDHKFVFSGDYDSCTAKCEEKKIECNLTDSDGFCPTSCDSTNDKDCVAFAGECTSDDQCKGTSVSGEEVKGVCYHGVSGDNEKTGRCTYLVNVNTTLSACSTTTPPSRPVIVGQNTTDAYCMFNCNTDTECSGSGTGWTCTGETATGKKFCARIPRSDVGDIGNVCTDKNDCASGKGVCADYKTMNFPAGDGMCLTGCNFLTLKCPVGSSCIVTDPSNGNGICFKSCKTNDQCDRGKGASANYYCENSIADGICLPYDGKICTDNSNCDSAKHERCAAPYKTANKHKVCGAFGVESGGKDIGNACDGDWECNHGTDAICSSLGVKGAKKVCSVDCSADGVTSCPNGSTPYKRTVPLLNKDGQPVVDRQGNPKTIDYCGCVHECTSSGSECSSLTDTECKDIGGGKMGCLPKP